MNEIFYKRICKLIAMNYGLSEDVVWQSFMRLNSIDKVIKLSSEGILAKLSQNMA